MFGIIHSKMRLQPAASIFLAVAILLSTAPAGIGQIRFSNGGSSSAIPAFGGYDPGSAARFGFQNGRFGLGLTLGQGSTRTNTFGGTSVVLPNGGSGQFFSGTVNHFVTGVTPVVGRGVYGPYGRPYYSQPYGSFDPFNFPHYHCYPHLSFPYGHCFPSNWQCYPPYGCGPTLYRRPIGYGIQSAPFAAPGSVWLNYPAPAVSNYRIPTVSNARPGVSRLNMLLKQNGGPNRTVSLSRSPKKVRNKTVDLKLSNRIPINSRNSTADKAVKSLAEIRKEMKARKAAELAFKKAAAERRKKEKRDRDR